MFPTRRYLGGASPARELCAIASGQSPSLRSAGASHLTRSLHTSPPASYDSTSYNVTDVPDFFVKYKQRIATASDAHLREHQELGLMPSLTRSIRSGDVVATTRRLKTKIPVEHQIPEGHIVHPSGFVVPGPGHTSTSDVARAKERERNENLDRAIQTAAVAHRMLESDLEQIDATTLPLSHKVPFEVNELDGTIKHPSGFAPPTPAEKFRYFANTNLLGGRKVSAPRPMVRHPSPAHTIPVPTCSARRVLRALHTSTPKAS